MPTEYIIYCDESTKRGRLFSNFYGGLLMRSTHLDLVRRDLENLKSGLNLGKELKWVRVTENYEQKYLDFLEVFFNLVEQDVIKVRVMFTQNIHVPVLSKAQLD